MNRHRRACTPHLPSATLLLAATLWLAGCADAVGTGTEDGGVAADVDVSNLLELGSACSASTECQSGLCLVVGQQYLCSLPCVGDSECPGDFYCGHVAPYHAPDGEEVPAPGGFCLQDRGGLCKPCNTDTHCNHAGDRCLDLGDGLSVCGRDCTHNQSCPTGYQCADDNQCWPIGNTCECIAERAGVSRVCVENNEAGTCTGEELCQASGAWSACDAPIPAEETCNGLDDNCDGILPSDELDLNDNGSPDCIDNCAEIIEICDGIDNNCDGEIDNADAIDMCGAVPNGAPECDDGTCIIGICDATYIDVDGDMATGCECPSVSDASADCVAAETIVLSDAGSGQLELRTGLIPADGERWYRVEAIDTPDDTCDNFHLRIRLTVNVGDAYRFDIHPDLCGSTVTNCAGADSYDYYLDFYDPVTQDGECLCTSSPDGPDNFCEDDSVSYLVRVYHQPGIVAGCDPFELELSNGYYNGPNHDPP